MLSTLSTINIFDTVIRGLDLFEVIIFEVRFIVAVEVPSSNWL